MPMQSHCTKTEGKAETGGISTFTLRGESGLQLRALNLGGIVTHLLVPTRDGQMIDVALGFDNPADYTHNPSYLGALIGRVAGRIPTGKFTLGGREHRLACNDGPNHLHGGVSGFDAHLWETEHGMRGSEPFLTLRHQSPDGEEGYPGNLRAEVTYHITAENTFVIEESLSSDAPTPASLTQHTYFNLAGEGTPDLSGHQMEISAARFVPCDDAMSPLGLLASVDEANDFRSPRDLAAAIPALFNQHGDLYRLDHHAHALRRRAAAVEHGKSGIRMEVFTTRPYMQLYASKHFDGSLVGKSGRPYRAFSAFCLECEGYPDAVNHPDLDDIILLPGQPVNHRTEYRFSVFA